MVSSDVWKSLFQPESVAIIGASNNPGSWGGRITRHLLMPKNRPIYAVNPSSSEVMGIHSYDSILDIPEPVDMAAIVVRAELVPDALKECVKKGVNSETPCTDPKKQKNEHGAMERNDVTNQNWIDWASPIWLTDEDESYYLPYQTCWFDINETDTLNFRSVRTEKDEKHLCPLQLDLIERCVKLWSNPGETVFSPFGGIGSESYMALKLGRKACTTELKKEYYEAIGKNCEQAIREVEQENMQIDLFGGTNA